MGLHYYNIKMNKNVGIVLGQVLAQILEPPIVCTFGISLKAFTPRVIKTSETCYYNNRKKEPLHVTVN